MGQSPIVGITPEAFNNERMGGFYGWITTVGVVMGFVAITQIITLFKDYLKQKSDKRMMQFMDSITVSLELLSNQYSINSSTKQIQTVSKLSYEHYRDSLIMFTNEVIRKNNIDGNWEKICIKVDEHVKVKFEEIVLASFMDFRNRSGKYMATYLKVEPLLKDIRCCIKELIKSRSSSEVVEDTLERKFSSIRMDYYKHISNDL